MELGVERLTTSHGCALTAAPQSGGSSQLSSSVEVAKWETVPAIARR